MISTRANPSHVDSRLTHDDRMEKGASFNLGYAVKLP